MQIEATDLNAQIDPVELLSYIGHEKSSPKITLDEVRDYCPIHGGDKQKSLSISLDKHSYFCHSCFATGDLIDLYQKAKGVSFKEALKDLANRFNCNSSYTAPRTNSMQKIQTKPPRSPSEEWAKASDIGSHPYLEKKKIKPCPGIRFGKDLMGNNAIVVPYYDADGNLATVQHVTEHGKFFLGGSHITGSYFTLGGPLKDEGKVYIAEGLATATTIWTALEKEHPVLSVGSAGNIPNVVKILQEKRPNLKIVLALDDSDAAYKARDKISPPFFYCIPSFNGMAVPKEAKLDDFNDLVSKCGQSLEEVRRQLQYEITPEKTEAKENFYDKLGNIIGDTKFTDSLKNRSYSSFELEHKRLFTSGGLVAGYDELDEKLYFAKGDFVTVQAMSNHGKTTLILQFAYKFLNNAENEAQNPLCLFVTYESMPLRIEEKLLNIISHELEEETILQYHKSSPEKYIYPQDSEFPRSKFFYNKLLKHKKLNILKGIPLEKLEEVVDLYKKEYPDRTIVLFLDYLQIMETNLFKEESGWERMKGIAYKLEKLAIEKEILVFAACQVNENRQVRESRDIYNASTINIDLLNLSHASLLSNKEHKDKYKVKINGKSVCTISVFKNKHGESFTLTEYFLFNGYHFEKKTDPQPSSMKAKKPASIEKKMKYVNLFDED